VQKDHLLRVVLISSTPSISIPLLTILREKEILKIFNTYECTSVSEAFHEIERQDPDLLLMAASLKDETDLANFRRLHQYVPHVPMIMIIDDKHKLQALEWVHLGAYATLLKSQINETLPAYLVRSIEKFAAQQIIRESEERFRKLIEHASDMITTLEPTGTITFAGPSTQRIVNYPHSDLVGRNLLDYIHRDDRNGFLKNFEKAFDDGGSLQPILFRFRHQEGHWLHMEGKGRIVEDRDGRPLCVLNAHDISHRVKLEEELRSLSLRDELTGLNNRRAFIAFFEQELKSSKRSQKKGLYLLFIDLDGFKWINDTLGHKEGDKALIEATHVLKATFRQADIIARLGGDEFVVLLSEGEGDVIETDIIKERLSKALEDWNAKGNRPYKLAMSTGILHHDFHEKSTIEELLTKADELMFEQKRHKKRGAPPETSSANSQSN
jgi:diguanylate cyclase (GGDEF)-like protein/PAS domain S-box-containing protein